MKKLLTMLYPRRCPFCDAVIPEELSACPDCLAGLKTANCNVSIKYTDSIVSLYLYEPPVSNAIVRMKFENCPDLADSLGRMMAAKLAKTFPGLPFDGEAGLFMLERSAASAAKLVPSGGNPRSGRPLFIEAPAKSQILRRRAGFAKQNRGRPSKKSCVWTHLRPNLYRQAQNRAAGGYFL